MNNNTQTIDQFKEQFLFRSENEEAPFVRITRIVLDNFKSVKHGEIVFNCGKQFVPYNTKSDILGLYGQNGSGKTALIEALAILERMMRGASIPDAYADCITIDSEFSQLLFQFELQFESGEIRDVVYSFCLAREPLDQEELDSLYKDAPDGFSIPENDFKVRVFNELFRMGRRNTTEKMIMQDVIDTSTTNVAFGPTPKYDEFLGKDYKSSIDLEVLKKTSASQSKSFIFNKKTLELFKATGNYSVMFQTLLIMRFYATRQLYVIDTKSAGLIRLNVLLPLYTKNGIIQLDVRGPQSFSDEALNNVQNEITNVSNVLTQLIPGLTISCKKLSDTLLKNGKHGSIVMLVAYRDGVELPLRDESDGVRKIISVLSLLIAVYNNPSFTLAIDEFDAGVFEYLLGEILETLENSGKGQFIFTSHNLRPLEIIDKKFLVFTTTNPNNRYYRLKSIGKTNNLRDSYFREILLGEQDEEMYNKTKPFKIIAALRKAGEKI